MRHTECDPIIQGALYLKRSYQKNMLIATLVAVSVHMTAIGVYHFIRYIETSGTEQLQLKDYVIIDPVKFQPPPLQGRGAQELVEAIRGALPEFGIPEPAPPDEVELSIVLPTRDQIRTSDRFDQPTDLANGRMIIDAPILQDIIPAEDSFIVYDQEPAAVHLEPPSYPEMARQAGIEATVIVRVLLNESGLVRDAVVKQSTVEGIGFEEAAIDAAMMGRWVPATQNDQPVPRWVTYTIVFELQE